VEEGGNMADEEQQKENELEDLQQEREAAEEEMFSVKKTLSDLQTTKEQKKTEAKEEEKKKRKLPGRPWNLIQRTFFSFSCSQSWASSSKYFIFSGNEWDFSVLFEIRREKSGIEEGNSSDSSDGVRSE
jgi:hypothetical protein